MGITTIPHSMPFILVQVSILFKRARLSNNLPRLLDHLSVPVLNHIVVAEQLMMGVLKHHSDARTRHIFVDIDRNAALNVFHRQ